METSLFFSFAESLNEPVLVADAVNGEPIWNSTRFTAIANSFGKKETDEALRRLLGNRNLDNLTPARSGEAPPERVMPLSLSAWTGNVHVRAWNLREKRLITAVFREEKTKAAERRRQALNRLSESGVMNSGDFSAAFRLITETAAKTMYANWAGIWRADQERNRLTNEVVYNLESEMHTRLDPFPLDAYSLYMDRLKTNRAVVIHDTRTDTILPGLSANADFVRVRSLMDCPIRIGGRLEGVVSIEYGDIPHEWTEEELDFGSSLADFASIALESSRAAKAEMVVHSIMSRLLATGLDRDQKPYASAGPPASDSLLNAITDVLDYSRAETGQMRLISEDFSLREMLLDLREMYNQEFLRKNLVFTVYVPADYPDLVRGDRSRLRQILMNLLSNALKFTAKGWVVLRCTHEYKRDQGRMKPLLNFQVADTGIGVESRLLTPTGPDKAPNRRNFGEAGLGLPICRRLAQMMGGGIECDSIPGSGSVFKLSVILEPAGDSVAPEKKPAPGPAKKCDSIRLKAR